MVRQQIGFLMLVVAATIGVIALSSISDTIRHWKTLDKDWRLRNGCVANMGSNHDSCAWYITLKRFSYGQS